MRTYTVTKHTAIQLAVTIVAASLLCFGVVTLAWPHAQAAWQRHQGNKQNMADLHKATQTASHTPTMQLGIPTSVSLPRLNINLDVEKGVYNPTAQTWTIDRTHAFLMQAPTGQTATPIIYGHDIPAVFEHLAGAADDEILQITNTQGQTLLFRYVGDNTLDPTNSSVLNVHFANSIILMTCSGAQFQHRRALRFEYVGVQSAPAALPKVSA